MKLLLLAFGKPLLGAVAGLFPFAYSKSSVRAFEGPAEAFPNEPGLLVEPQKVAPPKIERIERIERAEPEVEKRPARPIPRPVAPKRPRPVRP